MNTPDRSTRRAPTSRSPVLAGAQAAMHRAARRAHQRAVQTAVRDRATDQVRDVQAPCVNVTIRNPADPDRAWKGTFLVDPGATDSLVPRPHLEAIGLRPKSHRVCELTDGRELTVEVTTADIEFMGEIVGGTILLGEADAEALLGATALASAGIEVDPQTNTLRHLRAVRLKRSARTGLDDGPFPTETGQAQ